MKRLIWLLLCASLWAQTNNARMIGPPNYVTAATYIFVPADATRLTRFNNASGVAATLISGLNTGFGPGLVFSVQNLGAGTVTITCSSCTIAANGTPGSTFTLTAGAGADIYTDGQNYTAQTGSGSGGGGGAVSSVFGRTGGISASSTDYGAVGIQESVGSSLLAFSCLTTATCTFGNSGNFMTMFPTANATGFKLQDTFGNFISSGVTVLQGIVAKTNSGTSLQLYDTGEVTVSIPTLGSSALDMIASGATFSIPVNFAGTGGFQLGGSFGTVGQVACSTGSGVIWSSSCGGASGVTSVGFTGNQVVNTGTSTNPIIALVGGASSAPLILPGNLQMQQFANANNAFIIQRKTDTAPTGTLMLFQTAGGSTLGTIDVLGNLTFPTLVTNGSGGGYIGFQQGTDSSAACFAASVLNGICHLAPTTVTADYAVIEPGTAPIALSVKTSTAASGSETTESYTAVSGSTMANIACGVASLAGMGSGVIATGDGSGCLQSSGRNISTLLPSLQGPGSGYTNSTTSGTTVTTYGTTVPAASTVLLTCVGTYSFTTAVESAEFGINFSSAPTTLRLNVYIGGNPTTQSTTFGLQTTNGALITSGAPAASTGVQYPVRIEGGVTTNAATTFTVQGATSNASGTLNVAANGFTCSVR